MESADHSNPNPFPSCLCRLYNAALTAYLSSSVNSFAVFLISGKAGYHPVQNILSSRLQYKNIKINLPSSNFMFPF
jgi:hypothetical protein